MNLVRTAATMFVRQPDWRDQLIRPDGNPMKPAKPILANAVTALRNDPAWEGVLAFNEFAVKVETQKPTPWGKPAGMQWTDNDDRLAAVWLQEQGVHVGTLLAGEAVQTVALESSFHPVRRYLRSLRWDGEGRIGDWTTRYLGTAADLEIARTFGCKWLIAAVARVMQPGCKVDTCLILEGDQGTRKSTALRALGGEWFTDQISDLGNKDAYMQCHGVWIVELAELDSLSRSEVSKIKAFMSAQEDRFRLPYGRNVIAWARGCVFAGSVNHGAYLRDETGNRRFWPVRCGEIDLQALARDRDQLWAEALVQFEDGAHWWLEDHASIKAAEQEQAQRYESDTWEETIADWIEHRPNVTMKQVLTIALQKVEANCTQADTNRVARCLRSLGWERYQERSGDKREWRYRPKSTTKRTLYDT